MASRIPDLVATDKTSSLNLCSCDTGEPLPAKLAMKIQQGQFVELHEFLPKPMMEASKAREDSACTCCHNRPAAQQRSTRSVGDIFTWVICYNRYVAAVAALRPSRVASMLAHANTIVQAAQMFEGDGWREYDRAVRLQATATPNEDWGVLNLPLYARTFVAAERRRNVCRFCCSRDHASSQCPWGVDTPVSRPLPSAQASLRCSRPPDSAPQICRSWNAGSCRFPTSCNFLHICGVCYQDHRRVDCPRKTTPVHTEARRPAPWPPEAKRPAP